MNTFWLSIAVGIIAGYLVKRMRGEGSPRLPVYLAVGVAGALLAGWVYPGAARLNVVSVVVASLGAVGLLWGLRVLTRNGPMSPETAGKLKFGVWPLIGGAIAAVIVGFAWGGWTTAGGARGVADEAVLATRAAICVAQFTKDPNHQARLKELADTSSWERTTLVEKGGWDRMPGEDKASYAVSRACADGLEVLLKK